MKQQVGCVTYISFSMTAVLIILVNISVPAASAVAGTARIYGTVTDEDSGLPLSDSTVMFISESADTTRTVTAADGSYELNLDLEPLGVESPAVPSEVKLFQNYPNPFNPATIIDYELSNAARVELSVFNVMGQMVKRLIDCDMSAGIHRSLWDGRDSSGRGVSAGVYFYRLKADGHTITRKMLLLDGGGLSVSSQPVSSSAPAFTTKRTIARNYVMIVRHDGYLKYDNYRFSVSSDRMANAVLKVKSGETLFGEFVYNNLCDDCNSNNWDGVIELITVIVYDTNDYNEPLAVETVSYPDPDFEITGLAEGVVDVVVQGDDVISYKKSEMQLDKGDNDVIKIEAQMPYNSDGSLSKYIDDTSYLLFLKSEFNTMQVAEDLMNKYGCKIIKVDETYNSQYFLCTIAETNNLNSLKIVQFLHNEQEVYSSSPEFYFYLD